MLRQRLVVALVTVLLPTVALAQDPQPRSDDQKPAATEQESSPRKEDQPPAAVGESQTKPTRGFFSALFHNLGDDVKHMPRMNSVYWLAGGGALAAIVHPEDDRVNARLVNSHTDNVWIPGKVIGGMPTILGASFATYIIGRTQHMNRLQHLGMDEIEAAILSEGIVAGA